MPLTPDEQLTGIAALIAALAALGKSFLGGRNHATRTDLHRVHDDIQATASRLHSRVNEQAERVQSLETHQADIDRRLERIEDKVDHIVQKVAKL